MTSTPTPSRSLTSARCTAPRASSRSTAASASPRAPRAEAAAEVSLRTRPCCRLPSLAAVLARSRRARHALALADASCGRQAPGRPPGHAQGQAAQADGDRAADQQPPAVQSGADSARSHVAARRPLVHQTRAGAVRAAASAAGTRDMPASWPACPRMRLALSGGLRFRARAPAHRAAHQAREAPGYFDKIQEPMDLGTIFSNLKDGIYLNAHQVCARSGLV